MNNVLPNIFNKHKICIICEGYEEYDYFNKLIELDIFHENYHIVLENAKSNGQIPAMYIDKFMNDSYDIILVFCDTDREPYNDYFTIKKKIDDFHNLTVTNEIIMFGNPCTMQIILSHFERISLRTHNKKVNAPLIEHLTGVKNYKARRDQREMVMNLINLDNYYLMKQNLVFLSQIDSITPSTNLLPFLKKLEQGHILWVTSLKNKLENPLT
jgi:hypothetical protein